MVFNDKSNTMYVFVDESGCLRANQLFVAGAWFTWKPELWLKIVHDTRKRKKFWREMHFHKVSRKQNDKRYEMIQAILSHLVKYDKTWYFRMLFVSKDKQSKIWKYDSVIDIYDGLMSIFFDRFGGHYPENFSIITLDEKNRPCWDDYIPSGIEKFLNNKVGERTKTVFTVKTANSAWNDLLQVSDIITAAHLCSVKLLIYQ